MGYDFKDAYQRILAVTGVRTQTELADVLEVKQSSISDAMARGGGIPANWLVTLTEKFALNPHWVKTGEGAERLQPADGKPIISLKDYSLEILLAEVGRRFRLLMDATTAEDTHGL